MEKQDRKRLDATTRMLLLIQTLHDFSTSDNIDQFDRETECIALKTSAIISEMLRRYNSCREESKKIRSISKTCVLNDLKEIQKHKPMGLTIAVNKGPGGGCTIQRRTITPSQARTLSTIVDACSFISKQEAEELFKILGNLMGEKERNEAKQQIYVDAREHSVRNPTLHNIEIIAKALEDRAFIGFRYENREGSVDEPKKYSYKEVIPIKLVYSFGNFYLDALSKPKRGRMPKEPFVHNYRLDRMVDIQEGKRYSSLHDKRVDALAKNTQARTSQTFDAYRGKKLVTIILRYTRTAEFDVIERFGNTMKKVTNDNSGFGYAKVKVYPSPTFFRWVFGWSWHQRWNEEEGCYKNEPAITMVNPASKTQYSEFKSLLNGRDTRERLSEDYNLVMNGYETKDDRNRDVHEPGYRDLIMEQLKAYEAVSR